MKKLILVPFIILSIIGCEKKNDSTSNTNMPAANNPVINDMQLTLNDSLSTVNMQAELSSMQQILDSLLATPYHTHQLYWDSLYHQHDSLFWHYHSQYHHEVYTHDDHHHEWVPYDLHINHNNHYHHVYPGHAHDSLITILNHHLHNISDHHFNGHCFIHHHILDSLNHIHNAHHL